MIYDYLYLRTQNCYNILTDGENTIYNIAQTETSLKKKVGTSIQR